jgi:tetratricopeptide (TPR) repeat protein
MAAEMEDSRKAGEKAYQAGNFAESIRQFEALAQMDPENAAAFYYLGRSYGNQQNAAKEIEYLSRACKLEPKNPTYNIHLGQALQETKNYAEAIRYFEEGVRLGGDTQHSVATLNKNIGILKSRVALAGLLPYASNVKHDHFIGVGCDGRLTITEKGISFAPVKQKEHALQIGGLETLRSFTIKKNRLDIVLTTGKKYSFDVPDPAPLAKIAAALTAPR